MTDQSSFPPPPQHQFSAAPPARQGVHNSPRNGLGTAGFVLGLIGLIFSPIPIIGVVAWPLVILGLIFSIIGMSRARSGQATNKGLAITGIILSAIGLAICILWAAAIGNAVNDVNQEASQVVTVQYEVTGDASDATVRYTTYGDGITSNEELVSTLPWTKSVDITGYGKGASLTVSTGEQGGDVTCKVTVGDEAPTTAVASGPYGIATCSDF